VAGTRRREREAHRRTILSMLETTPATVARPVAPGQPSEPIPDLDFDWRPHPLARTVTARRTYRWPIVVGAAAVGAAVLVAASYLLAIPPHRASLRQAEYITVINEFSVSVDLLDQAPTAADPEIAAAFAEATDRLRTTAEASLPWVFPFVPLGPDLGPARAKLLEMSDAATALAVDVNTAARYREAADHILAVPLLPYSAPTELIDPASKTLTEMQADSLEAIGALDDDPAYEGFRSRAVEATDALPAWIDRYLLALRRNDTETATTLIGELQARKSLVESELEAVFAQVDAEVELAVGTLRAGIQAVRVLAG